MKVIYNTKEIGDNHNNYNRLLDKPLINSTELVGNITLNDINVYSKEEVKRLISSTRSVKVALVLPSPVTPNTTYYIGPDMNGIYTVYLTDSSDPINVFSIGTTSFGKYYSGDGINVTDPQNVVSVLTDSESVIINSEGLLEARPVFEKMVPFNGATASADGSKGIVPKPSVGDQNSWLTNKSSWELLNLIDATYPVGSIYITNSNTNPNTTFIGTTWTLLDANYALKATDNGGGGKTASGLPNIKGYFSWDGSFEGIYQGYGPFSMTQGTTRRVGSSGNSYKAIGRVWYSFKASKSNSVYDTNNKGSSSFVRPQSVAVCVWRRTA